MKSSCANCTSGCAIPSSCSDLGRRRTVKPSRLRIATYNIHKGVTSFRRRSRLNELRLALHRIDADILFLQEVQERSDRGAAAQLDVLASSGYLYRAYGVNAVYPQGHHGNAILSRFPIERYVNHDISDHVLERRGVLHAVVHCPDTPDCGIHLLCAHLGLIQASRLRQADWLAAFIEREIPPDAPLILGGDFNDWRRRVDERLRARLGLEEAAEAIPPSAWAERMLPPHRQPRVARTFPSFSPWLTLDRIYVRGFRALAARVPRGVSWARCSDHAPLIADLEWS